MPFPIIVAAAAVAGSVPILWWSVASARAPRQAASRNLTRGIRVTDLRELALSRAATERAVAPLIAGLAHGARRLTPVGWLEALERRIILAGIPANWPLERVLAAKLLLAAGGLLAGLLRVSAELGPQSILIAAVLTAIGWVLPDYLLMTAARRRQKLIQLRLPDTLDQMTICVEAGVGFEAAMARAGTTGEGPLAEELVRTLQEMNLGATRAQALRALARRTNVPDLKHFVVALLQAESYGLPIAEVLTTQSSELRVKRRQRAEEHAMKIPVKIVFPLILCILPSLFIVILGPGGIRLARLLSGAVGVTP